jgi:hypothetical protein
MHEVVFLNGNPVQNTLFFGAYNTYMRLLLSVNCICMKW